MKSNKVLLGLFVGILAMTGSSAMAQEASNDSFYEVGPANIGGSVSTMILDQRDANNTTVYAGATTGGLFVRSSDNSILTQLYTATNGDVTLAENTGIWHRVPTYLDGTETNLAISSMVQGPDNSIYIGTGDATYQIGVADGLMSTLGTGLYILNPTTLELTLVPLTKPSRLGDKFAAFYQLDCYVSGNTLYLFAATNGGLHRWKVEGGDWSSATYTNIYDDGAVKDFVLSQQRHTAYFTSGSKIFRIGDVTASTITPIDFSESNTAFNNSNNVAVKLAMAPTNNDYLYAMVIASTGLMEGLYLTTNDQNWTRLTTTTITPFTTNSGTTCGTIVVDPTYEKRVYIGGSSIWGGQGYVEGSYYQWTKSSYSESELNTGNYMSNVFNNAMYVHSGIHQMLPVLTTVDGVDTYTYYIATDGGVYSTSNAFATYSNINRGLNNVQSTDVAVSPDGSLVSGASFNASPFIQTRLTHHGGEAQQTWYDDGSMGNMNHDANITFIGNGGEVAASSFQQVSPQDRRTIFVSSGYTSFGFLARAYSDYLDFTNTQTWTAGTSFASSEMASSPDMGRTYLWETDNNIYYKDSIKVALDLKVLLDSTVVDTLGYYEDTAGVQVPINTPTQVIPAGSKLQFLSKAHAEYPFTFTVESDTMKANDSIYIKNPIAARMLTIGKSSKNDWEVFYSWRATDFTKVWDAEGSLRTDPIANEKCIFWAPILSFNSARAENAKLRPRAMTMTNDGRFVFVSVQNDSTKATKLYRISNFDSIDFTQASYDILAQLKNRTGESRLCVLHTDTMSFPRAISSINVDPRNDNRLIVTFDGYSDAYANVAIIENATNSNWAATQVGTTANEPVFSGIIEKTTGKYIIGTLNGAYAYENNAWTALYDKLNGVPVTSVVQQTRNYPVRHHEGYSGINKKNIVYAKIKWPNAIYMSTYGRGIFMDMEYVTDTINEVVDPEDLLDIPVVNSVSINSVSIYPNPVAGEVSMSLTSAVEGNGMLRIYDMNGRMVASENLGHVDAGTRAYQYDCSTLPQGMYLINISVGNQTAAAKMMVR